AALLDRSTHHQAQTRDWRLWREHAAERFLEELEKCVVETRRILKPDSTSCWVVGLHRDKAGGLLAMNHDVARLHQRNGFRFKEEIVVWSDNSGAIQRVGNFERGDQRLVRVHEYAMIFVRE
ncbi:MAG: hypothetical protein ABIK89_05025, partial [Planctomycetota bacterium]